jgi:hypothetical protein
MRQAKNSLRLTIAKIIDGLSVEGRPSPIAIDEVIAALGQNYGIHGNAKGRS